MLEKFIKPIETHYNGCRFRSRLEARWAVFFDTLGIKYDYEAEGYDLGGWGGWYLPDFWLIDQECFVEIKPYSKKLTNKKCERLNKLTGYDVLLVCGSPRNYLVELYSDRREALMVETMERFAVPCFNVFGYDCQPNLGFLTERAMDVGKYFEDSEGDVGVFMDSFNGDIKRAVDAASSARFERK